MENKTKSVFVTLNNHILNCEQFLLQFLSTKEIVSINTVDRVFCGLSRITGTLPWEREVPVDFLKCNFSML